MEVEIMDWLKELLKKAGIEDTKIDQIVGDVNKELPKYLIPKDKYNEISEAKKQLETDIKERDTQLETLKKSAGNNEELQKQIEFLQEENKAKDTEYRARLKELSINSALKLAVAAEVHDTDLVLSLLDKGKIELDDSGNIKAGLEEQVKALRESKAFLFIQKEEDNVPSFKGFTPVDGKDKGGEGDKSDAGSFGKRLAEMNIEGNQKLDQTRDSYFE